MALAMEEPMRAECDNRNYENIDGLKGSMGVKRLRI
jgi:hypothetical protein